MELVVLKNDSLINDYKIEFFSEIDKNAIKSYCAIHDVDEDLNLGDITTIKGKDLPYCHLWIGGFPCQDISSMGKMNGFNIRTKKIVNGSTTNFYLDGTDVVIETRGDDVLYYLRDNVGELIGFVLNDTVYYYQKNLQGDIIGIYNDTYQLVAKYEYDAWGNILNIQNEVGQAILDKNHIAYINSFRYRGYYYDEETSFYYINSRYYSPLLCRFLNIDSITYRSISSKNLYLYCDNNPVNNKDIEGNSVAFFLACAAVGAFVSVVATVVSNIAKKEPLHSGTFSAAVNGAIQGGTAVSPIKKLRTAGVFIGNFVQNTIDEVQSYTQEDKNITISNALDSLGNIVVNTSISSLESIYITSRITGALGLGTNPGWFHPTYFSSCFIGSYANKFQQETIVSAALDFFKNNWKRLSEYVLIM